MLSNSLGRANECLEIFSRYGSIHIFEQDAIIGRYLQEYGEWAFLETLYVSQFTTKYGVLDIGAFIGTFSKGLLEINPDIAMIHAFEPNPKSFEVLNKNILNDSKIISYNGFVGKGKVDHAFSDDNNPGSFSVINEKDASKFSLVSEIVHYDINEFLDSNIEFVKLDVEGMESEILKQIDPNILNIERTTIYAEANNSPQTLEIFTTGKRLGYDCYYFMFPSFNPDNFLKCTTVLHPFAYEAGLIFTNQSPVLSDYLYNLGCRQYMIKNHTELKERLWCTPRWGMAEWMSKEKIELIGILSKLYSWEHKRDYLMPPKE